jgi:thimet oligopeptidase
VEAQRPVAEPAYPEGLDPSMLARLVDDHLADATAALERLVASRGPRAAANTLAPYSDAQDHIWQALGLVAVAIHLHPDSAVRAEGMRAQERIDRFSASLAVDPQVAAAFDAVDTAGLTPEEQLLVVRARRDFHRSGADRDEATRNALRASFQTLDRLGTAFARNIAEDTTTFRASPDELAGMPPDWIEAHERDPEGRIVLTARYGDFFPVMTYAADRSLRRRATAVFANRGWPANRMVLDSLLRVREATARLVGYPDWATYQAETQMAESIDTIRAFIERVSAAGATARDRLVAAYLERLRDDDPAISAIGVWDGAYAAELIRREQHALDGREVRAYFPFEQVRDGLLDVTAELFGLEFRRIDLPVWHPSVETYEAQEGGHLLGHFYLDLHPRPGKYTHAATVVLRMGIPGSSPPRFS